jgi:hypothetical protein
MLFRSISGAIGLALILSSCGGGGGGSSGDTTPAATYSVGGSISGLTSGSLVLKNNGGDALTVNANSTNITFATSLANSASYAVTVGTQPIGLTCSVSNGTGTVASANVTNVTVTCADNWSGTKLLGVALGQTTGRSVATDKNGNVYVTGYTDGNLDGNSKAGIYDFFVTKYNSSGVKQFTKQSGVSGASTYGYAVATDENGNFYVAGRTGGNLDGNTLAGVTDFFVTKYNSSGVKQFTKQSGVSGALTSASAVATDTSGNVFVVGKTNGNLDGNVLTGRDDLFVTKYNSSGVKQYTRQLGANGAQTYGLSTATDSNGNVYVAGYTEGNLDGNTLAGGVDLFVTKYSSSGVKQYTKQSGVTGRTTIAHSVATDTSGNVYIAGFTGGNLDGNINTGIYDLFVTKYDSSGAKQFTKLLGASGAQTVGTAITAGENGNVYVAGYTNASLDGNTLTGSLDTFITKYSSSGVKQYTRQLGIAGKDTYGYSVATDANGNVYVAGITYGGLDGNTLTGTADLFVTKYNSGGVKQ